MELKPSEELFSLLNKGVARELQVSVQYILQYTKVEKILRRIKNENILLDTTTYEELGHKIKELAIQEMKHLGDIMERIYILGGEATTKSDPPKIGDNLKEYVELDEKAEIEALDLYDKTIKEAKKCGDQTTVRLFRNIYKDEEDHLRFFEEFKQIDFQEPPGPEDIETEHVKVYTDDYFALLNKAIAAELGAIIQYTNQHEKASKLSLRMKKDPLEIIKGSNKAQVVSGLLKDFAMEEMKHLDKMAERIYKLGGECVYNPDPLPKIGENVDDFLRFGKEGEDYAIVLYRQIVKKANELGDVVTKRLFESIIEDEDRHYWEFDDYF